jgi:HAE1 family hydrophobic/amphiphilic exporter-1
MIIGIAEAAQSISFPAMEGRMGAVQSIILKDPAVASIGSQIGATGTTTLNDGRLFIALKPKTERTATADQVINRLRPQLAKLQGVTVYMQAAQDITIGARVSRTQYQYTLIDADAGELNHWAPIFLDKIKAIPGIADVASDQANAGPLLDIAVNRDAASRYGILPAAIDNTLGDAFGQRIVSTMFTTLPPRPVATRSTICGNCSARRVTSTCARWASTIRTMAPRSMSSRSTPAECEASSTLSPRTAAGTGNFRPAKAGALRCTAAF